MNSRTKEITKYFRNAVAAQSNMGIDFKADNYYIVDMGDIVCGEINQSVCKNIFEEAEKNSKEDEYESKKKSVINVIVCAKTARTIFSAHEKTQDEIEELTGLYYIPAILNDKGMLLFDEENKKLPWFPREYLLPMVEPKLGIGDADAVDDFISKHVDLVEGIKGWEDYVAFFKSFYEAVTESEFIHNTIRNKVVDEALIELENNMFVFIDKTVFSTFHILNLYNYLLENDQQRALYDNFTSLQASNSLPLFENNLSKRQEHCAQMGGEYSLSPSQREAVNHFNGMKDSEILAINGPPGTGKTTLIQTIVADMFVKRALKKEKAPLIVASSTNNQAVTNIIASFGNIQKMGLSNLEERWILGINSFASYFPSTVKVKGAKSKGYQCTNQKGEYFVSEIEDKENIEKSKIWLLQRCNEYFGSEYVEIAECQDRLHNELQFFESSKNELLRLVQEAAEYNLNGVTIDRYICNLENQIEDKMVTNYNIRRRVDEWKNCSSEIPFIYKLLKFIRHFSRKIETKFRLFMNDAEQNLINEYMSFNEIEEIYSYIHEDNCKIISDYKTKKKNIERIKDQYDDVLGLLQQHNIVLHEKEDEKYRLDIDYINDLLDKKIRYVEFWLAVHYYECRWVNGEDELTEGQKGKNYRNIIDKFYSRLCMVTPCLVMTFYMLPKQFLSYGDQKKFFLLNYIDLLIVDEAGQVSPEIAAGAFSLAKKAVVVGDIYQIEPVWNVNRALDKAIALSNGAIKSLSEFELLEQTGLNSSGSSVMKVAAKSCKYEKFNEKGLFLSEHRRCYDEIIDYSNKLVYKGNLQPMRGKGKQDKKIAMGKWPQMGFRQIDTDNSQRKGSSRINQIEAVRIAEWLKSNFELIIKAYPDDLQENLVGIITPFKAQVKCLELELKKQMPEQVSKISIGTVHTFQGAERKIIILSTVYGKQDGCFFIDANKSLMNVAVSRAKDNFFVFGDINCLRGSRNSASGLLKDCISANSIE